MYDCKETQNLLVGINCVQLVKSARARRLCVRSRIGNPLRAPVNSDFYDADMTARRGFNVQEKYPPSRTCAEIGGSAFLRGFFRRSTVLVVFIGHAAEGSCISDIKRGFRMTMIFGARWLRRVHLRGSLSASLKNVRDGAQGSRRREYPWSNRCLEGDTRRRTSENRKGKIRRSIYVRNDSFVIQAYVIRADGIYRVI